MNNHNRKIGDRYFRIQRFEEFRVPSHLPRSRYIQQLFASNPVLVGIAGVAGVMILGALLLTLPFANSGGIFTPPLTAFFTSVSSVSTTGLTVVTTATYWTFFGQAVICGLVFLGGLGPVTAVMFYLWLIRSQFSLGDHILIRDALGFDSFEGLLKILRNVVLVDLGITIVCAVLLFVGFRNYYDLPTSLWQSLFHSVSAFNTAGLDIVGPISFVPIRSDALILSVCTVEQVLGAVSFAVLMEVPVVRRWRRFSLNTKIVLLTTSALYLVAVIGMLAGEAFLGTTLNEFSAGGKIFTSVFNALSAATTTGYASIDFARVTAQTLVLMTVVMFIGGASGSTAGGVRVNTVGVIFANIWATIRGKPNTEVFGREIEPSLIWRALTIIFLSFAVVAVGTIIIMVTNPNILFEKVLFEATSAFATCGLSSGALAAFSVPATVVIIFLMFIGRITPLSVALSLNQNRKQPERRYPKELLKLG